MDQQIGAFLNADMEFYKLCRHQRHRRNRRSPRHSPRSMDKRGVIGLGEPPAIGGIAAIANAVANAIGVRVPHDSRDRTIACLDAAANARRKA